MASTTNYHEQKRMLELLRSECYNETVSDKHPSNYCPRYFDGLACWAPTPPDKLAIIPCPAYYHGFNIDEFASRYCTDDGSWWIKPGTNETWTNYTMCVLPPPGSGVTTLFENHIPLIKFISKLGYSISLISLLLACLILASVKRLRCPRNILHSHLFVSFILRAVMFLLKDALFVQGVAFSSSFEETDHGRLIFNNEQSLSDCRVFTSFWHYFLMANYFWILMEGLYLHNLVFLAMFTDTSGIAIYIALGWGFPVLFITPWVLVRYYKENTLCWTTNKNIGHFWIIRGPITATIVLNFFLFINITRVLFVKMFASQTPHARQYRYRKWFKSTLVLVPLFGAHYTLLLGMSTTALTMDLAELIWLYVDQLFSSFQGFVVALLYCFLNSEVQTELRKMFQRWHFNHSSYNNHQSFLTQSITYLSRGRSSIQSIHSTTDKKDPCGSATPSPHVKRQENKSLKEGQSVILTNDYTPEPSPQVKNPPEEVKLDEKPASGATFNKVWQWEQEESNASQTEGQCLLGPSAYSLNSTEVVQKESRL